MVTITSRPALSEVGEQILAQYEHQLCVEEDLARATIRNYLSDLRHFAVWCESVWKQGREAEPSFVPEAVTTPTLTDYRTYLKPNSVNRSLISLKRYFAWLLSTGQIKHDSAKVVKLVGEEATSPRHLNDQEEQALVAAVTEKGDIRDRAIIVLMLHTGLRVRELCTLTRQQVPLGKRNGALRILGKRKKVREVPLNTTARSILSQYLETLSPGSQYLFPSEKTHHALTGRALGHLVTKYATHAQVADVRPQCLDLRNWPVKPRQYRSAFL